MKSSESSASESEEEETREETEEEEPKKIQPKTVQGIQLSPTIHLKDPDRSLGSKLKEPNLPGGGEKATAAKEGAPEDAERASDSASPETKEDSPSSFSSASRDQDLSSQGSLSRQGSEAEFLQVSVTLKENGGDESEYDQLDEDVLRNVKHSAMPDAADKVTRDDELKRRDCEASPKRPTPSPVHHTPSTSGTSSPASVRALEENKKPKSPKQDSGSAGATPPRSPFRRRSNTNESSGSAKSETETPEKKSGKFKAMFARNRSGSLDVGRSDSVKGEYEVKGKNSSSFAKFLQRKMSKDKKENAKGESSGTEREDSSPETKKKSEIPKEAVPAETGIPQEAKVADAPSSPKKMVPTFNIVPALQEENESPEDVDDCATVTMRSGHQASGKSRGSTYSRSSNASREQEPPPMVPEKTRIREKSPVHDIPRSNKPVPAVLTIQKDEPQVVEDKVVDGNISLEQINAILSAKEIRNKKRLSREQEILLEGMGARRPSSLSTTSVESDEPLPKTNFIDCDISSSSSGSLRDQSRSSDSMGSSDHLRLSADLEAAAADVEAPVTLRKPKLTESLTAGPRVSLTQPEFTVVEEDLPAASPETERQARSDTPDDHPDGNDTDDHEEDEEDETSEQNDYFPVVGVEVRPPSPTNLKLPDSPTLGITRLKAYIDEMEEEDAKASSVRTGISRLGHSAAVEKLKEEITDEPPRE